MKLFRLPVMLIAAFMMLGSSGYTGAAAADGTDTAAAVLIEGENRIEFRADEMDSLWNRAVNTSGSTIMLLDDWKIGGSKTVVKGADLNIDLNGHIIDRDLAEYRSEGNLFTVENGGRLTLSDSSPAAVHKSNAVRGGILTGGKSSNTGGCIEMKSGSSVSLRGCAIMSCATQQDGGAIRMNGVCELKVDGTKFCTNYAMDSIDKCHAGAIYIDDGTAIINNAVFDGNYTENNGGAIYIDDGEFKITGSLFCGNTAMKEGGAIYLAGSYNPLSVRDCTFLMNSCENDGGAINAYGCKRLAIDGSVFSRNNAGANGGPAGDLMVAVRIKPHELFTRDGANVYCEMPISFAQAAIGGELEVPTLDGKVRYSVPEGTQTGTTFRLRGKGIPYVGYKNRGDQFVTVVVETPTKLTKEQKDLLKKFEDATVGAHPKRKSFFDKLKRNYG